MEEQISFEQRRSMGFCVERDDAFKSRESLELSLESIKNEIKLKEEEEKKREEEISTTNPPQDQDETNNDQMNEEEEES